MKEQSTTMLIVAKIFAGITIISVAGLFYIAREISLALDLAKESVVDDKSV